MELYLIRHGIAQERELGIPDAERSLTDKGRDKTHQVAQRLSELAIEFDQIFTSPLRRAEQTARILSGQSQITVCAHLAPGGDIRAWLEKMRSQSWALDTRIALVGHQPDLAQWAEILVWGEARDQIVLKKAGIIGLIAPDGLFVGRSQLFWLTPPKFLL